jgi:hypothetical protein
VVDRVLQWVTWPLSWLRGHGARQVYGPPPDELQRRVASGRITIFTTHDDEADLALQLGAAPRQLYVEYVKAKLPFPASVLELILARPIVIGVLLSLLEVVLERYVLGFPWRHVLFMNYEMADLKHGRSYPKDILHRVDVSGQLLPKIRESSGHMMAAAIAVMAPPEPVAMPTQVRRASREVRTLYQKIALVVENFKKQLRLRHSVYYEVDAVIERVADVIARTAETTTPNDRVPEAAASAGP